MRSEGRSIASLLAERTFVKDPVHGVIQLNELERSIVETPVFMRLHGIKQLGFTYLVYPQAKHTRFEHSLGSMHIAGLIAQSIVSRAEEEVKDLVYDRKNYRKVFVELFRLSALLHDIGHLPFSHATENALLHGIQEGWVDGLVLEDYEDSLRKGVGLHEAVTCRMLKMFERAFRSYGRAALGLLEASTNVLCDEEVGSAWREIFADEAIEIARAAISGKVTDVDKLDYLLRDAYNTGAKFGVIDVERLVGSVKLVREEERLRVVIPSKFLSNVEDLYYARYMMFKHVYMHHRVIATEICYERALEQAFRNWDRLRRRMKGVFKRTPRALGDVFSSQKMYEYAMKGGPMVDDALVLTMLRTAYNDIDESGKTWFRAILYREKVLEPVFKREASLYAALSGFLRSKGVSTRFSPLSALESFFEHCEDRERLARELEDELSRVSGCTVVVRIAPPILQERGAIPYVEAESALELLDRVSPFIMAVESLGRQPLLYVYTLKGCKQKEKVLEKLVVKLSSLTLEDLA